MGKVKEHLYNKSQVRPEKVVSGRVELWDNNDGSYEIHNHNNRGIETRYDLNDAVKCMKEQKILEDL